MAKRIKSYIVQCPNKMVISIIAVSARQARHEAMLKYNKTYIGLPPKHDEFVARRESGC